MELRHFAGFVAVAEELSFSRAASRLEVGQPAVSRLIRQLEAELGVLLIERSTHHVGLTEAGKHFLPAARAVITQVRTATRLVHQKAAGMESTMSTAPTVRVPRGLSQVCSPRSLASSSSRPSFTCTR